MTTIKAILFDLDGTLLDTVPDLIMALNRIRADLHLTPLPASIIRPIANLGSRVMIKTVLELAEDDPRVPALREKFIHYYEQNIAHHTQFFPHAEQLLDELDKRQIPWGIVTNKLTRHGVALLKALGYDHRPKCVVYGDTLSKAKPHPEPILHACEKLKVPPQACLFVGDANTDMLAAKAAGTQCAAALYGYIDTKENPLDWLADGYINDPLEILTICNLEK